MQKYDLVLQRSASEWDESANWKIESSSDVYVFARDVIKIVNRSSECLWVLAVNAKGEVIGCIEASKGSLTSSIVSVQNIVQFLLLANAAAALLTHNHPSGCVEESEEDLVSTRRLSQALDLFEIKLVDHVIVSGDSYNSLSAKGVLGK